MMVLDTSVFIALLIPFKKGRRELPIDELVEVGAR